LALIESNGQHRSIFYMKYSLIGDVLELIRSVNEFLPNPVGKFDRREKVAYTEA
jgi:hypothetical protein